MKKTYQSAEQPLYEGKASRLFEVIGEPDLLIIERKNDITKLDGEVRDQIAGKGLCINRISNLLFTELRKHHIRTHFVRELSDCETLILKTESFPLEVIVRNIATGSLCKRLPITEGTELNPPLVELCYKSDDFHDPFINSQHAVLLGAANDYDEVDDIKELALSVNTVLWNLFQKIGIILVDFKLEFGRLPDGEIIVIDEISPDTCRLWDAETRQSLDKDIFRKGQGNDATRDAYRVVLERLTATE